MYSSEVRSGVRLTLSSEQPTSNNTRTDARINIMLLRLIILSTLMLIVMTSAQYYLERRLLGRARSDQDADHDENKNEGGPQNRHWDKRWVWVLRLMLVLTLLGLPTRLLSLSNEWAVPLYWISYVSLGFYALLFLTTLTLDMGGRGWRLTRSLLSRLTSSHHTSTHHASDERALSHEEVSSVDESRRALLSQGLALPVIGASASGSAYGAHHTRTPELIEVEITIPSLPRAFEGYQIVQISDLHVGLTIRECFARAVVELSLAQKPDMIALTGDLLDGTIAELQDDISPLAELKARDGIFYCTGNHEYYSGAEPWIDYFRSLGWRCLLNEHELIERAGDQLAICGITDRSAHTIISDHRSDPEKALKGLAPNLCKVMLAHQPKSIYDVPPGQIDLMLSGHTHGGQFFPWSVLVKLVQPYLKGLYQHDERAQVYVNQGTGYWGPPLRIGTRCEVTLITLRRADT